MKNEGSEAAYGGKSGHWLNHRDAWSMPTQQVTRFSPKGHSILEIVMLHFSRTNVCVVFFLILVKLFLKNEHTLAISNAYKNWGHKSDLLLALWWKAGVKSFKNIKRWADASFHFHSKGWKMFVRFLLLSLRLQMMSPGHDAASSTLNRKERLHILHLSSDLRAHCCSFKKAKYSLTNMTRAAVRLLLLVCSPLVRTESFPLHALIRKDLFHSSLWDEGWFLPPLHTLIFNKSKSKPRSDKSTLHLPTSFFHHCSDLDASCRSRTDHHRRWPQLNWFFYFFNNWNQFFFFSFFFFYFRQVRTFK